MGICLVILQELLGASPPKLDSLYNKFVATSNTIMITKHLCCILYSTLRTTAEASGPVLQKITWRILYYVSAQ